MERNGKVPSLKALIVVHSPTWFVELSQLGAAILQGREGHRAVFCIADFHHPSMHDLAEAARALKARCLLESEIPKPWLRRRLGNGVLKVVRNTIGKTGESELYELLESVRSLRATRANARAIARAERPDVVVLGGDMPGYTTSAFIRGFHDEGIPSVIVASTMSNGREQAEVYSGEPRHHVAPRWQARQVAKRYPRWETTHNGLRLLCCRPGRVLAMEAMGLAPSHPWVFNSGFADAIAMESQAMIDYYADAGLPRTNMVLTGSPSDDVMAKVISDAPRLRERLYQDLSLPSGKPMLLTALVPDFLYVTGGRPQCDFATYPELVDFFVGTLAEHTAFNVVIALHPSVKPETMRHLERPNVKIAAGRRTASLVPLCDVYVASISSTIRWAIACGKPVVNYDVYRYRYTDFLGVPGVLATEEKEEYRAIVEKLATDPAYREDVRIRQESAASRWGRPDGRSMERILELLLRVGNRRERPYTPDASRSS